MERFHSPTVDSYCNQLLDMDNRSKPIEALSAELFATIGLQSDRTARNRLIALRRTVHNLRFPRSNDLRAVDAHLGSTTRSSIEVFCSKLNRRGELFGELSLKYRDELIASRCVSNARCVMRIFKEDCFHRAHRSPRISTGIGQRPLLRSVRRT